MTTTRGAPIDPSRQRRQWLLALSLRNQLLRTADEFLGSRSVNGMRRDEVRKPNKVRPVLNSRWDGANCRFQNEIRSPAKWNASSIKTIRSLAAGFR